MHWLVFLGFGILGLLTVLVVVPLIQKRAAHTSATSFHHTHKTPVSRFGGIALATAFAVLAAVALFFFPVNDERLVTRLVIVGGSLAMFGLGLCDDFRPLGARKKLLGQILIAAAVCASGVQIEKFKNPFSHEILELGAWGWPVTIGWLVALTNMINLIDGIDGLAAGIALMTMALLLFVGHGGSLLFPVLIASGMVGALLGFLRFNFPPARIYMGDGGAYFLGFLIAIMTLVHSQKGTIIAALIAPLFALALPIVDVALAILRRGMKGLPIFRPDRKHLHHRLQQVGFSRTRTVLILYGISSVFLLMAFGVFWSQGRWVPILFGFLCLTLILSARSFNFSRDWFAIGRVIENSLEVRKETHYALALAAWLELEAERAPSLESLWADFDFTLKKMGFASAVLTQGEARRIWQREKTLGEQWECTHRLEFDGGMMLKLTAEQSAMSRRVFEQVAELAAESWLKAWSRWQANHPHSARTEPVAGS